MTKEIGWVKQSKGFTIVELLIVIVVIGILAAITIVAYNGINKRAGDAKRIDDITKIGKALQLWTASGNALADMQAGWDGEVRGWYFYDDTMTGTPGYQSKSIHAALLEAGFISDGINDPARPRNSTRNYMIAPCTDSTDARRVLMATLDTPPSQTIAQQLSGSGCNNADITAYTGSYNRNYARVF